MTEFYTNVDLEKSETIESVIRLAVRLLHRFKGGRDLIDRDITKFVSNKADLLKYRELANNTFSLSALSEVGLLGSVSAFSIGQLVSFTDCAGWPEHDDVWAIQREIIKKDLSELTAEDFTRLEHPPCLLNEAGAREIIALRVLCEETNRFRNFSVEKSANIAEGIESIASELSAWGIHGNSWVTAKEAMTLARVLYGLRDPDRPDFAPTVIATLVKETL